MSHTFKNKLVKTKKEHHCEGCTKKFIKGSELFSISVVDSGEFFNYYLCKDCDKYLKDMQGHCDDFFYGCLSNIKNIEIK